MKTSMDYKKEIKQLKLDNQQLKKVCTHEINKREYLMSDDPCRPLSKREERLSEENQVLRKELSLFKDITKFIINQKK